MGEFEKIDPESILLPLLPFRPFALQVVNLKGRLSSKYGKNY